jgi:hypothetical protein
MDQVPEEKLIDLSPMEPKEEVETPSEESPAADQKGKEDESPSEEKDDTVEEVLGRCQSDCLPIGKSMEETTKDETSSHSSKSSDGCVFASRCSSQKSPLHLQQKDRNPSGSHHSPLLESSGAEEGD